MLLKFSLTKGITASQLEQPGLNLAMLLLPHRCYFQITLKDAVVRFYGCLLNIKYIITDSNYLVAASAYLFNWIAAPKCDEPPLLYEEAMELEPMQRPPIKRNARRFSEAKKDSIEESIISNKAIEEALHTVTPRSEEHIEKGRRGTTSTGRFGSTVGLAVFIRIIC